MKRAVFTPERGKAIILVLLTALLCLVLSAPPALALRDISIPEDARETDLSPLKSLSLRDVPALAELLRAHPSLAVCDLSGIRADQNTILTLMEACPQIAFRASLEISGAKTDSLAETLDLDAMRVSKKVRMNTLRRVMGCMPYLKQVTLLDAKFELPEMEKLIADFPEIRFQWTVRNNGMAFRPGATAYSTLKGRQKPRYKAEDLEPVVRYCPDLLALDVGHNDVSDLSFLSAWPGLRRLIVVDSKTPLTDLTPLAPLEDLEYAELFMQDITDLTPLAGKTKLLDLNLCHNRITDLTPLHSCVNLQRLWISHNPGLTQEEIDRFRAAVPGCIVETEVWGSTDAGWRTHPRYQIMKDSFTSGTYLPFE